MTLIHFLRRSSVLYWVTPITIAIVLTILNPINSSAADVEGLYSGSFSGERSGNWFLLTDGPETGQVYFWIATDKLIDVGKVTFSGANKFSFNCTYNLSGTGSIDAKGKIIGTWQLGSIKGQISGMRQDLTKIKSIAGNYSGSLKGSEAGDLNLTIATNGAITGTVSWEKTGLIEEGNGIIDTNGKFIFLTQDDTSIYGTIGSPGEISGNWYNPFWETKGSIGDTATTKNTSAENNSQTMPVYVENQDNSSGCFIEMTLMK